MRAIDIVQVKREIQSGELAVELKNNDVLLTDKQSEEAVCIATLTLPNEWISVEERLPEESDGMVLFTNGRAVTSGYRNHMFRMSGEEGVYAPAIRKGGGYMRVTHWMYLPAPPDRRLPEGEEDNR